MKRTLKIFLITLIIIVASVAKVYAAETSTTEVTLTAVNKQAKVGDTVTIELYVNSENGIEAIDSILEYDKTKLELTTQGTVVNTDFINMSGTDSNTGDYKLTIMSNTEDAVKQAKLVTLQFKVLEKARSGETLTIALNDIQFGDSNDEWTDVSKKSVDITVLSSQTGTGNENGENGGDKEQGGNTGTTNGDKEQGENTGTTNGGANNKGEDKKPTDSGENSGQIDNQQSSNTIPHAGIEKLPIVLIAIIFVVTIFAYKKYSNLKGI